jgi:hypothetical protein
MNNTPSEDKSKAAFLVELDKMPGVQIQELPEEDSFMVFYPKDQHRAFRRLLDKYLSLFQVLTIEPEEDTVMGKAFSLIPNHVFEVEIDEEALLTKLTKIINESNNSPEVERERRLAFHPLPDSPEPYNENQQAFLEKLEEPERSSHARLFRIGNVTMRYMNNDEIDFDPTEEDFENWLSGLPERAQKHFRADGLEKSKGALPFRRFYMEYNDIGLDEYMKRHLSAEDYAYHMNIGKKE